MWILMALVLVVGCAPLNPRNTLMEDVGEVTLRTVAFPLTLGMYELVLKHEYDQEQKRRAYQEWFTTLSPREQELETARRIAALQALGMALSGPKPFSVYPPQPQSAPPINKCTAYNYGAFTDVTCR